MSNIQKGDHMLLDKFKSVADERLIEKILFHYHSGNIKPYFFIQQGENRYQVKAIIKSSGAYGVNANLDFCRGRLTIDYYCTCSYFGSFLCEHVAAVVYKFLIDDLPNPNFSFIKLNQAVSVSPSVEAKKIQKKAKIFLNYAREDQAIVIDLYEKLIDRDFNAWIDCRNILPGELWEQSITNAIRTADFFLACISINSLNKRGMIQKELKNALSVWETKIDSDIYLIPIRLQECEVPECLKRFHWVNLFEETGLSLLNKALLAGFEHKTY